MNRCQVVNNVFKSFSIKANCVNTKSSDYYEIFELKLIDNCRIASIEKIGKELQLALQIDTTPVFIPDYSSGYLQMIFVKRNSSKLNLSDIFTSKVLYNCECQIGIDSFGEVINFDITKAPHLLVVGTTGSGKSVFLNVLIANLVAMGNEASVYLIDPKRVEFAVYEDAWMSSNINVVYHTYIDTILLLKKAIHTMNERYKWMAKKGYKSIKEINSKLQTIYIIIDEINDLIQKDVTGELSSMLCELARKSRAAGIHLIIATQRASASVINGHIKANFPTRIIFKVASAVESRIVMDVNGAERLSSRGDGIIFGYDGSSIIRFKSAFVESSEVLTYTRHLHAVA